MKDDEAPAQISEILRYRRDRHYCRHACTPAFIRSGLQQRILGRIYHLPHHIIPVCHCSELHHFLLLRLERQDERKRQGYCETILPAIPEIQYLRIGCLPYKTRHTAPYREVHRMGRSDMQPPRNVLLGITELHHQQYGHIQED